MTDNQQSKKEEVKEQQNFMESLKSMGFILKEEETSDAQKK